MTGRERGQPAALQFSGIDRYEPGQHTGAGSPILTYWRICCPKPATCTAPSRPASTWASTLDRQYLFLPDRHPARAVRRGAWEPHAPLRGHPRCGHGAACRSPSLKRADLAKQVVAVILDPIFSELIALEPAHDYDGPRCFASGRGNALPLLALGGALGASLDAFVASKGEILQGVGGFRKGVEKAGHRISPGRDPMQAPVAEPVRHEIFRHVFCRAT